MKPVQMVDLYGQYIARKTEFDEALSSVISSSKFIQGPEVLSFQKELAEYLGVKHVVTCGNGTDALTIALWALDLPKDSEVITADFSFIAAAEAIARVGLTPVLADVDLDTFTLNPQSVEKLITPKTKAIIPVHLFGQSAPMDEIMRIAFTYNLKVIEDCAQCFGAEYVTNGSAKKLGTIGDIGCTSFFPSKNLGCFGDGGAIFTNNDELAEKIHRIANHGSLEKYNHIEIGVNSRLDAIQAAILRVKLKYIDGYNTRRQAAAKWYSYNLQSIEWLQRPQMQKKSTHVFHQYTLRVLTNNNKELQEYLQKSGIPSMIYYPKPLHEQASLKQFPHDDCVNSTLLTSQVLSLPMHTELEEEQIEYIVSHLRRFH